MYLLSEVCNALNGEDKSDWRSAHPCKRDHENNLRDPSVITEQGLAGYRTTATVRHYAKTGVFAGGTTDGDAAIPTREYTFVNIFPVAISNIDLAWETTDAIEEFTVEFAYDYWVVDKDVNGRVVNE